MSYEEVYKIPDEIKTQFSEEFYKTFWDELIAVFGDKIKGVDAYCDLAPLIYYYSSTDGWSGALKKTCEKLGLKDVWSYYTTLEWYDSERFDGEVEDELGKRFSKPTNGDKIRAMSDEELCDEYFRILNHELWKYTESRAGLLDWLKQEAET